MPIDRHDDDTEHPLGGDGVVLGDLEFTDDTGEMGSATANVTPGPHNVNIPLSPTGPGPGPKNGSVTGAEMGGPANVTSVEFIAPDITKAIHAQPGAYITKASATHAASVMALQGMEQPPVVFTGPVNYRDERQPPADQVEIEFVTGPGSNNVVQTRSLVNGVLQDTSPPPDLFNVVMLIVVCPLMGPTAGEPGQFFTTLDATTTSAAGTVTHGDKAPPPPEMQINA